MYTSCKYAGVLQTPIARVCWKEAFSEQAGSALVTSNYMREKITIKQVTP
jgi:hypothetical protein